MIYQVSCARYQPMESGSPSIERETCPLPLPRVPLDIASFTTYVCTFYPIRSYCHSGNVERAFPNGPLVGGEKPRSSTVLWPGSD